MKRSLQLTIAAAAVFAMSATGTVIAYASWFQPKRPVTLTIQAAKMPRGVKPSVAAQASAAVVSWSAQEIGPGTLMDHYVVTAHSQDTPPLPDVTHTVIAAGGPTESVTFTSVEVAGGRWRWTVVPQYRLWVGAASGESSPLTFPVVSVARPAGDSVDAAAGAVAPAPAAAAQPAPGTPTGSAPPPGGTGTTGTTGGTGSTGGTTPESGSAGTPASPSPDGSPPSGDRTPGSPPAGSPDSSPAQSGSAPGRSAPEPEPPSALDGSGTAPAEVPQ